MDSHGLLLLVDIIEAGNLSLAARKLGMSRANISYRLKRLENDIGSQLFRRTTRRIEPTEIGMRLYEHGKTIRDALRSADESVELLGRGLHGSVRLSLPTGFGEMVMSSWLLEFKRVYPDIALDVLFSNRVDDLLREEVDVAVRVMAEPPDQLVALPLTEVRYIVCASARYARTHTMPDDPADLAALPVITSKVEGRDQRLTAERGDARCDVPLKATLASENFSFLREAVLAGLGLGLVPDYLLSAEVKAGRVVCALDDWTLSIYGTRMFLLRMPHRYQTQAVRTLNDFIVSRVRAWAGPRSGMAPRKTGPSVTGQSRSERAD